MTTRPIRRRKNEVIPGVIPKPRIYQVQSGQGDGEVGAL